VKPFEPKWQDRLKDREDALEIKFRQRRDGRAVYAVTNFPPEERHWWLPHFKQLTPAQATFYRINGYELTLIRGVSPCRY
jgi:hypothetical protein